MAVFQDVKQLAGASKTLLQEARERVLQARQQKGERRAALEAEARELMREARELVSLSQKLRPD